MTTATFYPIVGGNDTAWRCEWPAEAVGGTVARIPQAEAEKALTAPNRDTALPWALLAREPGKRLRRLDTAERWQRFNSTARTLESLACEFPAHRGAAVFPRPCIARATLARAMRTNGVRTVAETDDNYFANPRLNLAARQQTHQDYLREVHAKAMASMDANVFSTAWLRDRYKREYRQRFGTRGQQLHGLPEMHVCRNHIPRQHWPEQPDYDGPVRVGFMGSPSHVWDLSALGYASFHAAKQVGCTTVVIGYNPADPDPDVPDEITTETGEIVQLRSDKSKFVRGKWREVVDRHIGWIDPAEYHRTALPLDIGLCPLQFNDFTAGKSDCKALEMVVNGAVPVISTHPVYTSAGWKHEVNSLMGGSPEQLALAVVRLAKDPKLRRELLAAGREMVYEERHEGIMEQEWRTALSL